jgi:UDP-N-acetylmuramate--alanine ligase
VLADIYAAGEDPIAGVTVDTLAAAIRWATGVPLEIARSLDDVVTALVRVSHAGDVVMTLGAGSIGTVPDRLIDSLSPGPRSKGGGM